MSDSGDQKAVLTVLFIMIRVAGGFWLGLRFSKVRFYPMP